MEKATPILLVSSVLLAACGGEDVAERADEIGRQGEAAIGEMEAQFGAQGDLLEEAPNTEAFVQFGGFSDRSFDKVYRYQANINTQEAFIWMSMDGNEMDDENIAITLSLRGISEVGEHTLDRQRNGDIYIELDGLAFRTDAGNAVVNLTSTTGDFFEGTFSATNVARSQNKGPEVIEIEEARFKLPLNDMRRN